MGIQQLWTILQPATTALPLEALANQRVVVDLSCWIMECGGTRLQHVNPRWQPHLHLNSLFHRLRALLALNCTVACVTDGDFDQLKRPTVTARLHGPLSQQQKDKADGMRYAGGAAAKRPQHSHFGKKVQEAVRLCEAMGIPCIRSPLDAEAQCAALNAAKLFDACITTDSDAFLFGASKVYRSFKLEGQSGCEGVVGVCTSRGIQERLGFGRNSLIALGMMLGSDYYKGVRGIGPQKATRLVAELGEERVLETILSEGLENLVAEGRLKINKTKAKTAPKKNEGPAEQSPIDGAAVAAVIKAYAEPAVHSPTSKAVTGPLGRKMALQINDIIDIMQKYLAWEPEKTKSFLLPKLAERGLRQRAARVQRGLPEPELVFAVPPFQYTLKEILRTRTLKYVRSYDVSWEGSPSLQETTVSAALLESAYPDRVARFTAAQAALKKRNKPSQQGRKAAGPVVKADVRTTKAVRPEVLDPLPENVCAAVRSGEEPRLDIHAYSFLDAKLAGGRQKERSVGRKVASIGSDNGSGIRGDFEEDDYSDDELDWGFSWRRKNCEGLSQATSAQQRKSVASTAGEGDVLKSPGRRKQQGRGSGAKSPGTTGGSRSRKAHEGEETGGRTGRKPGPRGSLAGAGGLVGTAKGKKKVDEEERDKVGRVVISLDSDEDEGNSGSVGLALASDTPKRRGRKPGRKSTASSSISELDSEGSEPSIRSIIASMDLSQSKPAPSLHRYLCVESSSIAGKP